MQKVIHVKDDTNQIFIQNCYCQGRNNKFVPLIINQPRSSSLFVTKSTDFGQINSRLFTSTAIATSRILDLLQSKIQVLCDFYLKTLYFSTALVSSTTTTHFVSNKWCTTQQAIVKSPDSLLLGDFLLKTALYPLQVVIRRGMMHQ